MGEDILPWVELGKREIDKQLADKMEDNLTMKEIEAVLFLHMNGYSSPGIDGFTVNYIRAFWQCLKHVTKDALNSVQTDGLSQTRRNAILKLLRKGNKDQLDIGNYRPISLLSVFYTIASCCITRRIKPAV